MPFRPALADKDAVYCSRYEFNINHIAAQAALPHSIDNTASVTDIAGLPIDQIIIGSSTNGRLDDLRAAADIIKGKRVDPNVRLLVIPGSRAIYLDALKKGLIRAFVESGAVVLNPGCAPCTGSHRGTLGPGERCLATTGNNSRGSMGSSDAEVYLVSPATAAASALKGVITDPTGYVK